MPAPKLRWSLPARCGSNSSGSVKCEGRGSRQPTPSTRASPRDGDPCDVDVGEGDVLRGHLGWRLDTDELFEHLRDGVRLFADQVDGVGWRRR